MVLWTWQRECILVIRWFALVGRSHQTSLYYHILFYTWNVRIVIQTAFKLFLGKSGFELGFSFCEGGLGAIAVVESEHIDWLLWWFSRLLCNGLLLRLRLMSSCLRSVVLSYHYMFLLLASITPSLDISARPFIKSLITGAALQFPLFWQRCSFYLWKVFSVILRFETAHEKLWRCLLHLVVILPFRTLGKAFIRSWTGFTNFLRLLDTLAPWYQSIF